MRTESGSHERLQDTDWTSTLDLGKTMKSWITLPFLVISMDVCGVIAEGSEDPRHRRSKAY